jgi:hypothetical protein
MRFDMESLKLEAARVPIQTDLSLLPCLQAAMAIEERQENDPTEGQAFLPYNQEPPDTGNISYVASLTNNLTGKENLHNWLHNNWQDYFHQPIPSEQKRGLPLSTVLFEIKPVLTKNRPQKYVRKRE